jgi:hypothetical protein
MTRKDKSTRDDFALGLGGMRTVASFTSVAAIPANRLRQDHDKREKKWRLWMPRRFRVA